MTSIVFAHANSFPAGTYGVLLGELRARGFGVHALPRIGHDPAYPVTPNWPHLVRQLADFARVHVEAAGGPVVLLGHSLGGLLSLMCASAEPKLARAVVMLDAPVPAGWRAAAIRTARQTGAFAPLAARFSPSAVSRRRRDAWPDRAAAHAHFAAKPSFARWDPRVLHDYIEHGTEASGAGRRLAFTREVESAVYDTLPHEIDAQLRARPLACPVAYIGGLQSQETRLLGGVARAARHARGRITMLDGTHLFPMEKPVATAAAIESAVRGMLG